MTKASRVHTTVHRFPSDHEAVARRTNKHWAYAPTNGLETEHVETVGQNENHKTKKQRRRFPLGPSFFLKQNVRSVQKKTTTSKFDRYSD